MLKWAGHVMMIKDYHFPKKILGGSFGGKR
jgi:hypothetical protein